MTTILSIQSQVAYGHVGNSAAVFPLQRLGVAVWPVPTVNFSNHTGYGEWRGRLIRAHDVAEVIEGVRERGAFPEVDAVLSGYQGGPDIGTVIVDTVRRVKEANPAAIYACDPVMGNARSGCFVQPGIPELLRDTVVPVADLIFPNQFELGLLTGTNPRTIEETLTSVELVRRTGPAMALVTSVEEPSAPDDVVAMMACLPDGAWAVRTPRLPMTFNGSGDLTAALFTAHWLRTHDAAAALARTASSVYDILAATAASGRRELQLVASQEWIAAPRMQFEVHRVA